MLIPSTQPKPTLVQRIPTAPAPSSRPWPNVRLGESLRTHPCPTPLPRAIPLGAAPGRIGTLSEERGEFNSYRFQLNLQRVGCLEGLEMQPIEGTAPTVLVRSVCAFGKGGKKDGVQARDEREQRDEMNQPIPQFMVPIVPTSIWGFLMNQFAPFRPLRLVEQQSTWIWR